MDSRFSFTQKQHFGAVFIQGRSGWGKTWTVKHILSLWNRNLDETVVHLIPDNYSSWTKWQTATATITNGHSVFFKIFNQTETYIIEDIQNYFLWNSSVRLKFLEQIKQISKHSNIIITMDTFGVKLPKAWVTPSSWNQIIQLKLPSMQQRMNYCKNNSVLSQLNTSQISFLLETMKDISFRSLERVSHFLQQSLQTTSHITFSVLRQATLQIGEIYLPPGLFSNAQRFVKEPGISKSELETIYLEDPFHFPYLIWNTLPALCYHNGKSWDAMISSYIQCLDAVLEVDDKDQTRRIISFQRLHHLIHRGWRVVSSVVFQIPNIRNKISYSRVRKKLLDKVVESANIPPMFVMNRCHEDKGLRPHIPDTIKNKHL